MLREADARRVSTRVYRVVERCAFAAFLLAAPLAAQSRTPPAEPFPIDLDRYIAKVLTQWQIPGLAIAVVRNDSVLVAKGYGVRALGRQDRVDQNTVFDIASITNSFTATAAAVLVDRGVLAWDDPVVRYLPDLVLPTDSLTKRATLRDFLSHRSGLDGPNVLWALTAVDRPEILRRMRYVRTVAPFRGAMAYSSVGYTVAGEATAAAARVPFETLLRDVVLSPLRMPSTTTYEQATSMPNVAAPHAIIAGRQQVIPRESQRRAIAPAAAVQSSATDLTRWMRLHLNRGVLDGKRIVSDSAMRAMHSVQVSIPMNEATRAARLIRDSVVGSGMGWQIADYRGRRVWWQTGNGNGSVAYMALFPDDRLGVVVLANTRAALPVPGALVNRIADAYLGFEPRDWAGEAFAARPALERAREENQRSLAAMRASAPTRLPLVTFAGRYDHPLYGPMWIRRGESGLTLQMGEGQVGDLEYHGNETFYVVWRDPYLREYSGAHLRFMTTGDSAVSVTTVINRDQYTAMKFGAEDRSGTARWRPDYTGVEAVVGRWNLRMLGLAGPSDVYGSWLEIERSGFRALVGRFVGLIGGARPIGSVDWSAKDSVARFTIPTEWEFVSPAADVTSGDLRFEVRVLGDSLVGNMVRPEGVMRAFVGKRAPILLRAMPTEWTTPVQLFNGKDLSGWIPAPTARSLPSFWTVRDGALVNTADEGANLMTVERYQDFKLHAEFRIPKGGTSGIFPRGRYWVILAPRADTVPFHGTTGAVHKFLVPNHDAAVAATTWHSIDITLVGRRITVAVNGKTVIGDQIIPGVTGSAIDTDEAAPGPIMLQGEETRVEFRNITISVPASDTRVKER